MEKSFNGIESPVSVRKIMEALDAQLIVGDSKLDEPVEHVYISDMMSSILAFGKPNSILLTSVAARQSIISAHMAEFKGVVFLSGKVPQDGSANYASENDLVMLTSPHGLQDACSRVSSIISEGCSPKIGSMDGLEDEPILLRQEFSVSGGDFSKAGIVSTEIKSILRKIGFNPNLVRRVAISTYEAEMNVVTHADQGKVYLSVAPSMIEIIVDDIGKGIPDIDLAMQEGYTTASEEIQAMGFGSGMGLPNIRKNSDDLKIFSEVDKGTKLIIHFYV